MKKQKVQYVKLREEFNPGTQKYEPVLPLKNKGKRIKQEPKRLPLKSKLYIWSFPISVILTIIIHYFLISKLDINSTLQVLISFIIMFVLLILLSLITYFLFKEKKKSK